MQSRYRTLLAYAAVALFAGALALPAGTGSVRNAWSPLLVLPWAAFASGSASAFFAHPHLAASPSRGPRVLADALPGAGLGVALAEAARRVLHALAPNAAPVPLGTWMLDAGVVLFAAVAVAWLVWRARPRGDPVVLGAAAAGMTLLNMAPATRPLAALVLIALHALILLALVAFHRPARQWAAAAGAGAVACVIGLIGVMTLAGNPWPPELILDARDFFRFGVPVLLLSLCTAAVVLAVPARAAVSSTSNGR